MLTTGDVAKLFNVSAQTVINWLEQGRLPFERIGNGPPLTLFLGAIIMEYPPSGILVVDPCDDAIHDCSNR